MSPRKFQGKHEDEYQIKPQLLFKRLFDAAIADVIELMKTTPSITAWNGTAEAMSLITRSMNSLPGY